MGTELLHIYSGIGHDLFQASTKLATGASVSAMEPGPQFMKLLMDQIKDLKDLTLAITTQSTSGEATGQLKKERRDETAKTKNCLPEL